MFDKFTTEARRALDIAGESARRHGQSEIGTHHLLIGLATDAKTTVATVLGEFGVTAVSVDDLVGQGGHDARLLGRLGIDASAVHEAVNRVQSGGGRSEEAPPYSIDAKKALGRAVDEAAQLRSAQLTPDHLMLGVLDVPGPGTEALLALGADPLQVRQRLLTTIRG